MALKKILIAEDEKAMANAVKLKLEKNGMEAVVANNGLEAVEELKKGNYDLALLDLMMPIKDGFEVLEDAKKLGIKTPIIVASNLSQNEDIQKAKDMGAIDFFVKSDTPIVEVVEKVKKALGI
jgi:DNA-binding response OmpR family regulator